MAGRLTINDLNTVEVIVLPTSFNLGGQNFSGPGGHHEEVV
jgi:hypothetical protein